MSLLRMWLPCFPLSIPIVTMQSGWKEEISSFIVCEMAIYGIFWRWLWRGTIDWLNYSNFVCVIFCWGHFCYKILLQFAHSPLCTATKSCCWLIVAGCEEGIPDRESGCGLRMRWQIPGERWRHLLSTRIASGEDLYMLFTAGKSVQHCRLYFAGPDTLVFQIQQHTM